MRKGDPQRVDIAVFKWNPATAGYSGAALLFLAVYFTFDRNPPWWLSLLAMAAGFVVGLIVRHWWRNR